MHKAFRWPFGRRDTDLKGLTEVENYLQTAFEPVAPSQEFVSNLRTQLLSQIKLFPGVPQYSTPHVALLLLAGFFSGAIMALIALRSFLTLLSTIGLIRHYRRDIRLQEQVIGYPAE
jgi:hypothetical protein